MDRLRRQRPHWSRREAEEAGGEDGVERKGCSGEGREWPGWTVEEGGRGRQMTGKAGIGQDHN